MTVLKKALSKGEEDNGWILYITTLIMTTAAGLFVIARCAKRHYYDDSLGWDDALIVGALVWCSSVSTRRLTN